MVLLEQIIPNLNNYLIHYFLDALSFYVYDAGSVLATTIARRPSPPRSPDKGQSLLFHELMHSWVAYEILKVLIIYGLQPTTLNKNLNKWSEDLYDVFTYVITRNQTHKQNAERLLDSLLNAKLHNGHFTKSNFGTRSAFLKMENGTLSLVIITWLRQLQQFFCKADTQLNGDWSKMGKYTPTTKNPTSSDPLSHIFFTTCDKQLFLKQIKSLSDLTPIEENDRGVCTSLEEWAMRILKPSNKVQLGNLYEISYETEKRWTRSTNETLPKFCIEDVQLPTSDKEYHTTENPKSFSSSSNNMKGKSIISLISTVNAFLSNQYTTANAKKNSQKSPSKRELNNMRMVFDATTAMTELANQVCENANYNNFDEMLVNMAKEESKPPTKKQKQGPSEDDSETDNIDYDQSKNKKRPKKQILIDLENDSDDDDYTDNDDITNEK